MNTFVRNVPKIITPQIRFYSAPYRSAISLANLYPDSNLNPPNDHQGKFTGYIPIDQLDITYSKSSGPGGQNVNKVNTKVEVRFSISTATWISDDLKMKLTEKLKNKITKEGFVIFRSDITRSQQLNLADCLEKIRVTLRSCITDGFKPDAETPEKIRRRIEKAARERLAIKRMRSQVKSERQSPTVNL